MAPLRATIKEIVSYGATCERKSKRRWAPLEPGFGWAPLEPNPGLKTTLMESNRSLTI